jgi:lysosomal acid phosphatase
MNWVLLFCCFTFLLYGKGATATALLSGFPVEVPEFANTQDKLIHVHAVWRHGERNPSVLLPKGDLNNISAFENGLGQLTNNGIKQLYTLGQNFRSKYVKTLNFLSADKINTEVYARSTDADRALISAMSFFSGLYTKSNDSINHKFAPVPIHSQAPADDPLQFLSFQCPRKDLLWNIVYKSSAINAMFNESMDLLEELSEKFQLPMNRLFSFNQLLGIQDTVYWESILGYPLPTWLAPKKPELNELIYKYFAYLWGFLPFPNDLPSNLQQELKKITSGFLLAEVMDRMALKIKCLTLATKECDAIKGQKFYAYSGHDITQVSLFNGLGFENYYSPMVGSALVLELWEDAAYNSTAEPLSLNEKHYVKILHYANSSVKVPKYIGCQGMKGCPISYLSTRAELLRPQPNLKTFCQQPL